MSTIDLRTRASRHELQVSGRPTSSTTYSAVLNLFAIAGALLLAVLVVSAVANLSMVVFRSGSMAPEFPTGTIVLVRSVPASQVHVGDVVTVDRPGLLPITHRVVATAPSRDGSTSLTLRGDANPTPDPEPYETTEVRRVVATVPSGYDLVTTAGAIGAVLGAVGLGVVALTVRRRR